MLVSESNWLSLEARMVNRVKIAIARRACSTRVCQKQSPPSSSAYLIGAEFLY